MVELALKNLINETIDENVSISGMMQDISELKQDVTVLKDNVTELRLSHEIMMDDIKYLKDGMMILLKRDSLTDRHEAKIEKIEEHTDVLKTVVTKHVQDKSVHLNSNIS